MLRTEQKRKFRIESLSNTSAILISQSCMFSQIPSMPRFKIKGYLFNKMLRTNTWSDEEHERHTRDIPFPSTKLGTGFCFP